jgi:hypothetical protein
MGSSQGCHASGEGECQSSCCVEKCSCGCGSCGNCPAGNLLDAVKCAKKSLLKEKIKDRLEKSMGKHLDQMADLAVEMLMAKHEMKKEKMQKKHEMMQKMQEIMSE